LRVRLLPAAAQEPLALQLTSTPADGIGWRQVSHPGIFEAERYIHEQALGLQRLAEATDGAPGGDVRVEVTLERFNGGVSMDLFGKPIINAFRNRSAVAW